MSMCEWPVQLYGYDITELEILNKEYEEDVEEWLNIPKIENELLSNGLSWITGGGNDSIYIGVIPCYPWNAEITPIKTLDEANKRIYAFLKKYFRIEEGIIKNFNYISEIGWG